MNNRVLIGNCFSLTLVRKGVVTMEPRPLAEVRKLVAAGAEVHSFWGHENTRAAAEKVVGFSLRPRLLRPAIVASLAGLPMLDGETFDVCWVLSPDYAPGYRPAIGVEVDESKIKGWKLLKLTWKTKERVNG